ncbi:MAG: Uma2 family endonuclease [Oscillospiraceae bacterium]|nr:Uma2 family endonuclease [Oscillospiraceae bacterium]
MSLPQGNRSYTYEDYCKWDTKEGERWELIDGVPYAMSSPESERRELMDGVPYAMSSPSERHQDVSGELFVRLHAFLKGKPCKVFHAPFDVRLNANEEDNTVVQPDLLVVCDKSKLDGKSCKGAPDLVIEIISPSSLRHDRMLKYGRYMQAGVREYWIVEPDTKLVQVCTLQNNRYVVEVYDETSGIPVKVLDGCIIEMADVFGEDEE